MPDSAPAAGPDSAAKPERVRHEAFGLFFISEERAAAYAAQRADNPPPSLDEVLALIFARQEEAAQ
jgi:hypothetical protein